MFGSKAQAKEAQAKEEENPLAKAWQYTQKEKKGEQNVLDLGSFSFTTKEEQKKAESALQDDPHTPLRLFTLGTPTPPVAPAKGAPATQNDPSPVDLDTAHVGARKRARESPDSGVEPEQRTKSGQDVFAPTVRWYTRKIETHLGTTRIKAVVIGKKKNELYDVRKIMFSSRPPYGTKHISFDNANEQTKNELIFGMTPTQTEHEANEILGLDQRHTINPLAQMRLRLRI